MAETLYVAANQSGEVITNEYDSLNDCRKAARLLANKYQTQIDVYQLDHVGWIYVQTQHPVII